MDLIQMDGRLVVAGPDTEASVTQRAGEPFAGLRFRPGILPRLLGVPAAEVRNQRVPLTELRREPPGQPSLIRVATELAATSPRAETAPWSLSQLSRITRSFATGANVGEVADTIGWSRRTLQRHCSAVYGYGPATLRRVLRFRRAMRLLDDGLTFTDVAVRAGYSDQPHLHREAREFAGVSLATLRQDSSGANRSTQLPSGSATVA
jgi:AraC-like DNA-binding protein